MAYISKKTKKRKGESAMDAALRYLEPSARTKREIERRLDELEYGEAEIMITMDRLAELGLADDTVFCTQFVESRLRAKPVSRKHLYEQLRAHEADESAIEEALASVEDETEVDNAFAVAEKYYRQFRELEPDIRLERVEKRLFSRGFSYDTIRMTVEKLKETEKSGVDFL